MSEYLGFLEDDLGAIMASQVFDEPMIFDPDGQDPQNFRAIFSGPGQEQTPGAVTTSVMAQDYSISYREKDLPRRLVRGDLILARAERWRVYRMLPDGQGLLTVSIQRGN